MKTVLSAPGNEKGYVMIIALMILALVTAIGVMSRKSSITEVQIATNELKHKITFFEAEGGSELASELLEQNISCPGGFKPNSGDDFVQVSDIGEETVTVFVPNASLAFWSFKDVELPSSFEQDIRITHRPKFYSSDEASTQTNITLGGETRHSRGAALQIAAGYEGKGKGAAGGGMMIVYSINSQHEGSGRSESIVRIGWRHNIGQEGDCLYKEVEDGGTL